MTEEENDSYVVIVDMQMGFTKMFETKGYPIISEEDDLGNDGVVSTYVRQTADGGRAVTVGVIASGSWNTIEVRKGTRGDQK